MTGTNQTQSQVNDINKVCDKFINSLGNGRGALSHLHTLAVSVAKSRDTTVFANAIKRAESKGDANGVNAVKFVVRELFPGVKVQKDTKANRLTFQIKGIKENKDVLKGLREACEDKLSIRGSEWKLRVKPKEERGHVQITPEKAQELVDRDAKSRFETIQEMEAYAEALKRKIAALKAEEKKADK